MMVEMEYVSVCWESEKILNQILQEMEGENETEGDDGGDGIYECMLRGGIVGGS